MPASLLLAAMLAATELAATAPVTASPSPATAEMQLRAINHRTADAHRRADPSYMAKLIHRDFLFTDSDGTWLERDDFLARSRVRTAFAGIAYDDVQVRLFGDAAIVHGVLRGHARAGDIVAVRYTAVYVRNDDRWRLVGGQNTPIGRGVQAHVAPAPPPRISVPWHGQDPGGDDDIAILAALNAAYVQAFRTADVAWYDAHLAPDYQVVFGDGSRHGRNAALADFAKPYYADGIADFPLDKVRIRRFGDIALIHAENAYTLKDGRKGVNRYTDVWVKRDDRWWCVAAHITVRKPPTH